MDKNIFEKIRDRESPADILYQDQYVTAFTDIYPSAPVHILLIPNKLIKNLNEIENGDEIYLAKIMLVAKKLAKQYNIEESGYRVITNCNKDGGQEVDYLHFHLVGGVKLGRMIGLPKESKKRFNSIKK